MFKIDRFHCSIFAVRHESDAPICRNTGIQEYRTCLFYDWVAKHNSHICFKSCTQQSMDRLEVAAVKCLP